MRFDIDKNDWDLARGESFVYNTDQLWNPNNFAGKFQDISKVMVV